MNPLFHYSENGKKRQGSDIAAPCLFATPAYGPGVMNSTVAKSAAVRLPWGALDGA